MTNNVDLFINDFLKVKNLGFQKSRRANSTGIGKTFEDLIGVAENNDAQPDLHGFEIKSQRSISSSYVTLFTKAPTLPKNANTYLRLNYGYQDTKYEDIKILHTSAFCGKYNSLITGTQFSLQIDRTDERVYILIKQQNGRVDNSVYYSFESLKKAMNKIENLAFVVAKTQQNNNIEEFHFTKATLFSGFRSFEHFLNLLEAGIIMYDIRIGAYKSGKNRGKTHDHGSGFRIKRENMHQLYTTHRIIE